jgi:hypothetical protein
MVTRTSLNVTLYVQCLCCYGLTLFEGLRFYVERVWKNAVSSQFKVSLPPRATKNPREVWSRYNVF